MIRGSIAFANHNNRGAYTLCMLDDDGKWAVSPSDPFLAGWLNSDCSPRRFGPADGDPEIAAIESANRMLGGDAVLPDPLPGPGPNVTY